MGVAKPVQIMIIQVFIAVFLGGCTSSLPNEQAAKSIETADTFSLQQNDYREVNLVDSTQLITELYKGKEIIPSEGYSDFSYSVSFDEGKKLVTVKSSNTVGGNKVEYFIELKDTAGIYSKDEFSTFDDSYKYVRSYFRVNGKRVEVSKTGLANLPNEKPAPSLLWYEKDFGISGKYHKIGKKEFFLLRGLDLYCNGRQCTSYQVFVIQKKKRKIKANTFYFSGLYPYDFENTFLFDEDGDGNPEMFVPKDIGELRDTGDFEKFELEFSRPVKME